MSNERANEREPTTATDTGAPVSWTRLECDSGRLLRSLELTCHGATLYVRDEEMNQRTHEPERPPRIDIIAMKSGASASRSLALRVENARKNDYTLCAPVLRALPSTSTADDRRAQRTREQAERLRRLRRSEDDTLAFFVAWHAAGHDPARSFRQEAQHQKQRNWNQLAAACAALCAQTFAVVLSDRTVIDEEHGWRGAILAHHLADLYDSPAHLARLAIDSIDRGARTVSVSAPTVSPAPNDVVSHALLRFRAGVTAQT